jgi:hypothetical protein
VGTPLKVNSAATTNITLFRAGPTNLFELTVTNKSAAVVYVKLYDKATAPVLASDVPVLTIPVGITAATVPPVSMSFGDLGKSFPLGLGYAITGAVTDTDATAVATGVTVHATVV